MKTYCRSFQRTIFSSHLIVGTLDFFEGTILLGGHDNLPISLCPAEIQGSLDHIQQTNPIT